MPETLEFDDVLPKNVFVYGTLKRGHGNNRLLEGARFVGEDKLHITGLEGHGFPVAKFTDDVNAPLLKGEIFEVTTEEMLRNLDRLEGHPRWYRRKKLVTEGGIDVEVYDMRTGVSGINQRFLTKEGHYEWN